MTQSAGTKNPMRIRFAFVICMVAASATYLAGCFPIAATGVVVGALSVSDRRTTGAQTEDQTIELKAFNRLRDRFKSDKVSLSVTSFNRIALLTGYVPDEATRVEAAKLVASIENVRSVLNETVVGPAPSVTAYAKDTVLTTRVKASLIEDKEVQANVIKVYTEASVVFLMGIVTEREAKRATDIASRVSGVRRVIRAFEIISEDELKRIQAQMGGQQSPAPSGTATPQGSAAPAATPSSSPSSPSSAPGGAAPSGTVVTPIR